MTWQHRGLRDVCGKTAANVNNASRVGIPSRLPNRHSASRPRAKHSVRANHSHGQRSARGRTAAHVNDALEVQHKCRKIPPKQQATLVKINQPRVKAHSFSSVSPISSASGRTSSAPPSASQAVVDQTTAWPSGPRERFVSRVAGVKKGQTLSTRTATSARLPQKPWKCR